MANSNNQNSITNKLNPLTETESSSVLNHFSHLEIARPEQSKNDNVGHVDDELILALQNEQENCRARQVFEWETARRKMSYAFARGAA